MEQCNSRAWYAGTKTELEPSIIIATMYSLVLISRDSLSWINWVTKKVPGLEVTWYIKIYKYIKKTHIRLILLQEQGNK